MAAILTFINLYKLSLPLSMQAPHKIELSLVKLFQGQDQPTACGQNFVIIINHMSLWSFATMYFPQNILQCQPRVMYTNFVDIVPPVSISGLKQQIC